MKDFMKGVVIIWLFVGFLSIFTNGGRYDWDLFFDGLEHFVGAYYGGNVTSTSIPPSTGVGGFNSKYVTYDDALRYSNSLSSEITFDYVESIEETIPSPAGKSFVVDGRTYYIDDNGYLYYKASNERRYLTWNSD